MGIEPNDVDCTHAVLDATGELPTKALEGCTADAFQEARAETEERSCPHCEVLTRRVAELEGDLRETRAKAFDALEAVMLEGLRDGQVMLVGWTAGGEVSITLPDGRFFRAEALAEAAQSAWVSVRDD